MLNVVLRKKPDAGNPHARFDGREVASGKPRRGSSLFKKTLIAVMAAMMGATQLQAEKGDYYTAAKNIDSAMDWPFTFSVDLIEIQPGYLRIAGWMFENAKSQQITLIFSSSAGDVRVNNLNLRSDVNNTYGLPSWMGTGFDVCLPFKSGTYTYDNNLVCHATKPDAPTVNYRIFYYRATINKPTATFDRQGGTGGTASTLVDYSTANPTITVPAKEGYTFLGYYTGANGTGTKYYKHDGTSAKNWAEVGGKTLYACWANPNAVSTWSELKAALEAGYDVKLAADVQEDSTAQFYLDGTQQVTLDLNGHTITKHQSFWIARLTSANAKLTLTDTSVSQAGKVVQASGTTHASDGAALRIDAGEVVIESGTYSGLSCQANGGFAYVAAGAKLTMNGGTITNCAAASGGAIYNAGTTIVSNGTIVACSSSWAEKDYAHGGGAAYNAGTMTIHDGDFTGNVALNMACGGVFFCANGKTITIDGGVFTDNSCDLCGTIAYAGTLVINGGEFARNHGAYDTFQCIMKTYGGSIHDNTTTTREGVMLCEGSVIAGGRFAGDPFTGTTTAGTIIGGVFDRDQTSCCVSGYTCTQVGDNWVVGQSVAQVDSKLVGGTYTFCPTNAEYVAAGVAIAPWIDIEKNTSATPVTYALADNTSSLDVGTTAVAKVKDSACWITGSGTVTDTSALKEKGVKNLVIDAGITGIDANAFDGWTTLRDVSFGADCVTIGEQAFLECFNLTNVTFAAKDAANVGAFAFYRCNSLEKMAFAAKPTFGDNAYTLQAGIYMTNGLPRIFSVPDITFGATGKKVFATNELSTPESGWVDVTNMSDEDRKAYRFFKIVVE